MEANAQSRPKRTAESFLLAGHLALGFFIWRFAGQDRVSLRLASAQAERHWSLIPVAAMTLVVEGGVSPSAYQCGGNWRLCRPPMPSQ